MKPGILAHLALILLAAPRLSIAQPTASTVLDQRVTQFTVNNESFLQALVHLASCVRFPMGIEWVDSQATQKPITQTFTNSTVAEIMKQVVSLRGYKTDIRNGVVHVYPAGSLDDGTDFLNTYINKFEVSNQTVAFAGYRLRTLIRNGFNPADPTIFEKNLGPPHGISGSIASGMGDEPISFTANHVLVRDLLDKFASASDLKIWIVTYPPHDGLAFGRIRKSKSVYSKMDITESEQPIWEFIVWGYDPASQNFREDWYKRKMTPDARKPGQAVR